MMHNMVFIFILLAACSMFDCFSGDIMNSSRGYYRWKERSIESRIRTEELNCTDHEWAHCKYMVKHELCEIYRKTLRNRCRRACRFCGSAQSCAYNEYGCCWDMVTPAKGPNQEGCPRNCHNRLGLHKYAFLKLNGACTKIKNLMDVMCRGVCYCEKSKSKIESSCSMSEHGCCWDGFTTADKFHKNCPVCKDAIPRRICRTFRLDCTNHVAISGWQMRRFCPRTCGVCRFFKKKFLDHYAEDLKKEMEMISNHMYR
eukprot:Seg1907.5 transcript_id=Seg1907.5/GoldUCD/mRNA.D3Y31 product="hypothetical protein" protein_id=Seg1907.5/GoldUCD/D3Y31